MCVQIVRIWKSAELSETHLIHAILSSQKKGIRPHDTAIYYRVFTQTILPQTTLDLGPSRHSKLRNSVLERQKGKQNKPSGKTDGCVFLTFYGAQNFIKRSQQVRSQKEIIVERKGKDTNFTNIRILFLFNLHLKSHHDL